MGLKMYVPRATQLVSVRAGIRTQHYWILKFMSQDLPFPPHPESIGPLCLYPVGSVSDSDKER